MLCSSEALSWVYVLGNCLDGRHMIILITESQGKQAPANIFPRTCGFSAIRGLDQGRKHLNFSQLRGGSPPWRPAALQESGRCSKEQGPTSSRDGARRGCLRFCPQGLAPRLHPAGPRFLRGPVMNVLLPHWASASRFWKKHPMLHRGTPYTQVI